MPKLTKLALGAVAAAICGISLVVVTSPAGAHGTCDDHEYQVHRGEPGYSTTHDQDGDGIGCESLPPRPSSSPSPSPAPSPSTVAVAATSSGDGAWTATTSGGVKTWGAAAFDGAVTTALNAPVVGMARTGSGGGYWLLARDGGVFSFGDAKFHGSTGNMRLNQPIVSLAAHPEDGYWFVAADGGIFSFGAPFHGSAGAMKLNQPVVGMAPTVTGSGYWLVARDGGIFSFGDARFSGSTGAMTLNQPIVGMATDPDGEGYWFVAADGGIFSFDATFHGSAVGMLSSDDRVAGMAPHADGGYYVTTASGELIGFGAAAEVASPSGNTKLSQLRVAAPNTTVAYDRGEWRHWIDEDGDCQDTRAEVLIIESTVEVTTTADGCRVVTGRWVDVYTDTVVTNASELDVDHMVPLADAHRSGGHGWDATEKQTFANDLTRPHALIAVTASANRSKGDRSPDDWKPPLQSAWCSYATWWVDVKWSWSLTVTTTERDALESMLDTC